MYINNTNNAETKSYAQIKADNPEVSLPAQQLPIVLTIWYIINSATKPDYDSDTQRLVSDTPEKIGNEYFEAWTVVDISQGEMDSSLSAAQSAKYIEIWNEASRQNVAAEASFFTSGSNGVRNDSRLSKHNARIANKNIKSNNGQGQGQGSNPEEDEFVEAYNDCMDWEVTTNAIANDAEDDVDAMGTPSEVNAYDAVNDPPWQEPFIAPLTV